MKKNRTPVRPLLNINARPIGPAWRWNVTLDIASSGYVVGAHVIATRGTGDERMVGAAMCDVTFNDDVSEVMECLAIESMLAACEPTLYGDTPVRRVIFSSNL
jgi:hypothetical protein